MLPAAPHILIVEDCPETRYMYKRYLDRSGSCYRITEAETVDDGLAVLRARQVDCVLLDYCLPDADGLDLLSQLCQTKTAARVPVVMITGHGDETVAVDAMKLGAKDYLVKQRIDQDSLVSAVEYALRKAQAEREEHRYRQKLEHESVTDPLTGLNNRRCLFEQLGKELRRATRYRGPLSLMLIDLDNFKSVNDERGHVVGDRVLKRFAQMLTEVARSTDLVARYGGEEFCVVLTNTDLAGAEHLAERVRVEALEIAHRDNDDSAFRVSCSIGLASSHVGELSAEAMIRRCDRALYDAKNAGRNQVRVYDETEAASA